MFNGLKFSKDTNDQVKLLFVDISDYVKITSNLMTNLCKKNQQTYFFLQLQHSCPLGLSSNNNTLYVALSFYTRLSDVIRVISEWFYFM